MKNILSEPLDVLLERLVLLYGVLSLLKNQLDNLGSTFRQSLSQASIDVSKLFAGYALPLRDISPLPSNQHFRGWFLPGSFIVQGEEYFQKSERILWVFASWSVSQSYEASVTYLRDLLSLNFFHHRDDILRAALEEPPAEGAPLEDWKTFYRQKSFTPVKLLKTIRRLSPKLPRVERDNLRNINLAHWYRVLAEVRHAIVHSDMLIKNYKIARWRHEKLDILLESYSGSMQETGYYMRIDVTEAKRAIEILAEYCYVIFGSLSELKGYEWDYSKTD